VVMLDLEDSCPPDQKVPARSIVIDSLKSGRWQNRTLSLRVNDPATPAALRDVLEILPEAGSSLDTLVIPKVESAAQVHYLDALVTALEQESGAERPVGFELILESARGLRDAPAIAAASSRNRVLVFGIADYSASMNMPLSSLSGHGENDGLYPGDPLHFAYSRLVLCARAEGLQVIDAPYGDFRDLDSLRSAAARSRALGFDGKWAIHPAQIEVINQAFSPSEEEISRARQVLEAHEKAQKEGRGSTAIGNSMIDHASVRMAENVLARAGRPRS